MKLVSAARFMSIAFFSLALGACGSLTVGFETAPAGENQSPGSAATTPPVVDAPASTPTAEILPQASLEPAAQRYTFEPLGISLEVPAELYVVKNRDVDFEDPGRLDAYQFYIQNYGAPDGPSSGNFQMYGHFQFNLPTISWDEFAANTLDSPMNTYANEIEINGLRGFDTQLSGERNRYVYQFYLDGHILSIAVADPTPENKARADAIINTLNLAGEGVSSASHLQMVKDPNGLYWLYIPDDWRVTFNPVGGIRVADLQASSPDADIVVEETDGPHSMIHYKDGYTMNLVVLEDSSALSEPVMASILDQYDVYANGISGTAYVFTEPSTAEGQLRELRFFHQGRSYLLRFAYPQGADQEVLDFIARSLYIPYE